MAERSQAERRLHFRGKSAIWPALTVEHALYGALALLALLLRLYGLGRRPMQPQEAQQALASWQLLQGQPIEGVGHSPLLLTVNLALFALLGADDAVARLVPALLGTLLVLLPYGLRRWLGREGALVTAAFLALSPLALFNARYLGEATAVAVSVLLVLIALAQWLEGRQVVAIRLAVAGLSGLLLAGAGACTMLLILASFGVLVRLTHGRVSWVDLTEVEGVDLELRREEWKPSLRWAQVSFLMIIGLMSTAFFLNPGGLQAVLDLAPTWVRGFVVAPDGLPLHQYLALLPLYEPLPAIFGLAGLILAWRRRDPWGLFLSYWVLTALVLTSLMAGRGPGESLLVLLPLVLLAGRILGQQLPEWLSEATWGREGFSIALASGLAVYALLQLSFFSRSGSGAYLQTIGVAILLLAAVFAALAYWSGREPASRAVCFLVLLVGSLATLSATWEVNFLHLGDPHELILATPISLEVRTLIADVARLSAQRAIDEHAVHITLHRDLALPLAWYLRDYPNLKVVEALGPTVDSTAVIAPAVEESPSLAGPYGGQDYALRSWWSPVTLRGGDWAKWLLRREAMTPPHYDRLILWVQQEGT